MKNFGSNAAALCLMIFLLIGVAGCMKKDSAVDKMIAYMNLKYDDRFEYAAPFGGGTDAASTQIIVKSDKYPDAKIWVEYYTKDGKEILTDNYVSYKYEEQTRNTVQSLLESIFGDNVKIRYEVGTRGKQNHFTDTTSFEDYIASPASNIGFQAFVLTDDSEKTPSVKEEAFRDKFQDIGLVAFGTIYLTNDPAQYEKAFELPSSQLGNLEQIQFNMREPGLFEWLDWRGKDD